MAKFIKLDFDGFKKAEHLFNFLIKKKFVISFFKLKIKNIEVYNTNRGYHVYIDVENKLELEDIIFIQAVMGSDFKRECFNWSRIKKPYMDKTKINVLFKEKKLPKAKPTYEIRNFATEKLLMEAWS